MKKIAVLMAIGLMASVTAAHAQSDHEPTMWIAVNNETIIGCPFSEGGDACQARLGQYMDKSIVQSIGTITTEGGGLYCTADRSHCVDVGPGDATFSIQTD